MIVGAGDASRKKRVAKSFVVNGMSEKKNYKGQIAFGLLDCKGKRAYVILDTETEPNIFKQVAMDPS